MSSLSPTSIDWNSWWQYKAIYKGHYVTWVIKFDRLDKEFPLFHFTRPTCKLIHFWVSRHSYKLPLFQVYFVHFALGLLTIKTFIFLFGAWLRYSSSFSYSQCTKICSRNRKCKIRPQIVFVSKKHGAHALLLLCILHQGCIIWWKCRLRNCYVNGYVIFIYIAFT